MRVRLGATTALTVVMPEARFVDEITVIDETPVVDHEAYEYAPHDKEVRVG